MRVAEPSSFPRISGRRQARSRFEARRTSRRRPARTPSTLTSFNMIEPATPVLVVRVETD
jgi:hypothetical protein